MSGRKEQDMQREKWIERKLSMQPQLIKDYMLSAKRKTSSTRKAYLGYIIQYVEFISSQGIKLTDVKPLHIDRYVDYISKDNGNSIVNTKLAAVSDFYEFLKRNDFVQINPLKNIAKLKMEKKETVVYMTEEEVVKIKETAVKNKVKYKNRDLCIITLGCATGLRVSAIRNIDIEDIDFDNMSISVVEKGNNKRDIYIGENTTKMIKQWMSDRERICGNNSGPLFVSQKHNRIAVRTIETMIHNSSKEIEKHITPHKMRSTCAMKLYGKTGDIYLTAQQLGHANIANTMIYAKATEEKRREAAILLD